MMTPQRPPKPDLFVMVLACLAFGLSGLVSRVVFERLPHLEDEIAYDFQADVFARGQVVAPLHTPSLAFWQPFVIEHEGTRFGKYPPAWPALLAVGVLMGAPWWVNAACAALTVALTYRFGAEVFGRSAGRLAALLVTFSPMAILLNATLMAHTSALMLVMLLLWAYQRTVQGGGWRWGALAGLALGALAANRPLTALAVAVPFIVWSAWRFWRDGRARRPLLMMAACALLVALSVPWFSWATVGDPTANLYTRVPGWEYDRIGFGPEVGRNGHTLAKGIQFARYDLSMTAADLFGWQAGGWSPMLTGWAVGIAPEGMTADSYWPVAGLSFLLLPLGIAVGVRGTAGYVWAGAGLLWVLSAVQFNYTQPELWVLFGVGWWLGGFGLAVRRDLRAIWAWALVGVMLALVLAHMAYWVGSQRYSTRYYFEALGAAAVLSALPLATLADGGGQARRRLVLGGVVLACLFSLMQYSVPRVSALRGYNRVTGEVLAGIEARRASADVPVFVLITGTDGRWRTRGALMAVSSPFLDGDIQFGYVEGDDPAARARVLAHAVGRQVIEMGAARHDVWFIDTCADGVCDLANRIDSPTLLGELGG